MEISGKDPFSLEVIHETSELSIYIDRPDLTELISSIKGISTSILSLWCSYLHGIRISKNVNELFRESDAITSYIQNKLDDESKKCYLGSLLDRNHWQLFVICPQDNDIFWFCSLHTKPKKRIKVILERTGTRYHSLRGVENKKPNWKIVKVNDLSKLSSSHNNIA